MTRLWHRYGLVDDADSAKAFTGYFSGKVRNGAPFAVVGSCKMYLESETLWFLYRCTIPNYLTLLSHAMFQCNVCNRCNAGNVCNAGKVCNAGNVYNVCNAGSAGKVCNVGNVCNVCNAGNVRV